MLFLLSGCALFAPKERVDLNKNLPERFTLYAPASSSTQMWWHAFESSELNGLIEASLTNNLGVQQAWARLVQADAVARQAGAARYPWLQGGADASRSKNSITYEGADLFSLGLNASYEVDLWGRIKSNTQAARLSRDATAEQLQTVALTLSSQVALRWAGVIAQREQTQILQKQLQANEHSLELIELRFRQSISSALDIYQQRQIVAGTKALIPLAQLRATLLEHELAALLGSSDFQTNRIATTMLPQLGPPPAVGIPADLLANRPDIRQAGLRLKSADWMVSAARANRLPAIRLTASGNYKNSEFSDLFDDWFAHLAASLTGPIFEGGRRKAEVDRARAAADEALAAYREVVIQAIKEVEDALASEQRQREYADRLFQQTEAARKSYQESVNRYRNGMVEYTTVLLQLDSQQRLERQWVEAQYNLVVARINLYRALGGSILSTATHSSVSEKKP
jgi:NodT family efflux transporter outer membrane factor (OMF) lipoprotein